MNSSRFIGIDRYLPPTILSSEDVERRLVDDNPGVLMPAGLVEGLTGVKTRRVVEECFDASDLAVWAARNVLAKTGLDQSDVDLLIFASSSQDLTEPATANLVQAKLGTDCPVFDLKNACNSFISAIQVADSLIRAGEYQTVLITSGENPTKATRWKIENQRDLKKSFIGYTVGDAGAAALLGPSTDDSGIFHYSFKSVSDNWDLAMIPGGGTMHPRDKDYTYLEGNGRGLIRAFQQIGPGIIYDALSETGTTIEDYSRVLVHQVSIAGLDCFLDATGIPAEKVIAVAPTLGNIASTSMPVGFSLAVEREEICRGDKVMWVGLSAGISVGVLLMEY